MGPLGARVCTKAAVAGQWAAAMLALAPLLAAGGCSRHGGQAAQNRGAAAPAEAQTRQTPSGLPVPRWISLKFAVVNARAGPGDDYPLKWIYRAKGLPLQVVAETEEWRRVCDDQGALSWVHRRTTNDVQRTVIRDAADPLPLRKRPSDAAAQSATLVAHAIAEMKTCKEGWCKLAVGHVQGWAPADQVWGAQDPTLCRQS